MGLKKFLKKAKREIKRTGKSIEKEAKRVGQRDEREWQHVEKKVQKEAERVVQKVGIKAEKMVGLDPEYKASGEWKCGIHYFVWERKMTPTGFGEKTRHVTYRNTKDGNSFQAQSDDSFHACHEDIKLRIKQSYGYQCSDPLLLTEAVRSLFSLLFEMGVENIGGLFILPRRYQPKNQ